MAATKLTVLVALALCSCQSASPRERLDRRGVPFTTEAFVERAKQGSAEVVRLFLAAGMDPNATLPGGGTAIAWAVNGGHADVVRALLEAGADVNVPAGNDGMTLLMLAAQRGDSSLVRLLLDAKADVDERDGFGNSALLQAVGSGKADAVELLLEHEADPNVSTQQNGATPLTAAAAGGATDIVRLLIAHGAHLNAREAAFGMTPLAVAAFKGEAATVRTLLDAGADPNAVNKFGQSALDVATAQGYREVVALLERSSPPAGGVAPRGAFAQAGIEPPEGWVLADPFTDRTPYWPGRTRLRTTHDPTGTRRALLRSPLEAQSQAFLILGDSAHWGAALAKQLDELDGHPLVQPRRRGETRTKDGVAISFRVYRMLPGLIAGEDLTYLLGSASIGERVFVVDAGGVSESFDPEVVLNSLGSLDLGKVSAASDGEGES